MTEHLCEKRQKGDKPVPVSEQQDSTLAHMIVKISALNIVGQCRHFMKVRGAFPYFIEPVFLPVRFEKVNNFHFLTFL